MCFFKHKDLCSITISIFFSVLCIVYWNVSNVMMLNNDNDDNNNNMMIMIIILLVAVMSFCQ